MLKFLLVRKTLDKFELIATFDEIEEAIKVLSEHWLEDWVAGKIFIFENIPLKLVVGF